MPTLIMTTTVRPLDPDPDPAPWSFRVICPRCNDTDATVTLDLNDLGAVECSSCGETYSADEAARETAEAARTWAAVARWVELAATAIGTDADATD
jgi:Zn ribbon nucleic-acid-binding protein